MSAVSADPAYLMGRTEAERGRLQRQAQLYGPLTRQLFVDAGIGRGMRVLDVGSGVGDVALLAPELVGPTGSVVGIDVDAEALRVARSRVAASGWQNITFVDGDVRTAALDGVFDAAVGRFVLVWVRDVAAVLRACAARVRPGGVVAFQEHDTTAQSNYLAVPPSRLVDQWQRALEAYRRASGAPTAGAGGPTTDPAVGYHLYGAFLAAGLPAPQLRYDAPIGGGPDWTATRPSPTTCGPFCACSPSWARPRRRRSPSTPSLRGCATRWSRSRACSAACRPSASGRTRRPRQRRRGGKRAPSPAGKDAPAGLFGSSRLRG